VVDDLLDFTVSQTSCDARCSKACLEVLDGAHGLGADRLIPSPKPQLTFIADPQANDLAVGSPQWDFEHVVEG
jgi:hypothetical protein